MASPHTSNVSTESRAGLPGSHASFTNHAALWLIALAGYAAIAFSSSRAGVVEIALDPARIKAELGPAYEIDLDLSRGDLLSAGGVSDLVLFDSHAELGPAHARHPEKHRRHEIFPVRVHALRPWTVEAIDGSNCSTLRRTGFVLKPVKIWRGWSLPIQLLAAATLGFAEHWHLGTDPTVTRPRHSRGW